MKINHTFSLEELRKFRTQLSDLRGRDWQLGFRILMRLDSGSAQAELAERAVTRTIGELDYRELSSIDFTGSVGACLAFLERAFPGNTGWSFHKYDLVGQSRVKPEGPYSFNFELPGLLVSGCGWTPSAAILDAIISGLEWLLKEKEGASIAEDDPMCHVGYRYDPSVFDGIDLSKDDEA